MANKTTDAYQYLLRLPKPLAKRLMAQAKRSNVSLNQEIVNQLEDYEGATVKRTTEIVQPLLQEAVRASATTAAEVATEITRTAFQEALDRIAQEATSPQDGWDRFVKLVTEYNKTAEPDEK